MIVSQMHQKGENLADMKKSEAPLV